jgi:hypothetical protein
LDTFLPTHEETVNHLLSPKIQQDFATYSHGGTKMNTAIQQVIRNVVVADYKESGYRRLLREWLD